MIEISQPPPIRDAVAVADQIANFAHLDPRGSRVVQNGHKQDFQLAVHHGVSEGAAQRQVLAASRGVDVEIRQHLLAFDENIEDALVGADTWVNGTNPRVFNVFIEGEHVLTNFDIYASAGGKNLPLSRAFTNSVVDSQLEVLFVPILDNARASGIQVRKIGDLVSDSDGI